MARKQEELPGTRRDDEAPTQKPIAALDAACTELEKAKGKAIKASQGVVEAKKVVDGLLRKHELRSYLYDDLKGVEKRAFISEGVKTEKVKTEKSGDGESGAE